MRNILLYNFAHAETKIPAIRVGKTATGQSNFLTFDHQSKRYSLIFKTWKWQQIQVSSMPAQRGFSLKNI